MDIMGLAEAQGLTAHDVRQWLRQQAPRIKRTTNVMTVTGMGDVWTWPSGDTVRDAKMDVWLSSRVKDIALLEGRTVQSLLREINPRMRDGVPSKEARDAHQGEWIGRRKRDGLTVVGKFSFASPCRGLDWPTIFWAQNSPDGQTFMATMDGEAERGEGDDWSFWPCDAHGNKVLWPTGANKEML